MKSSAHREDAQSLARKDKDLLRKMARSDPEAWKAFLERFGDFIYSQIYYTLRRHNFTVPDAQIEDAVQDLFGSLLENGGKKLLSYKGKGGCSLSGWLRVVCVNHTLALIRRQKRTLSLDELTGEQVHQMVDDKNCREEPSPRDYAGRAEALRRIEEAASSLSPTEKIVFQFYYRDERTSTEIADSLGIKSNHVNQLLYRIRSKLCAAVGEVQKE